MEIDTATKDKLKVARLTEIERKYYNLQLDVIALEAVGDIERVNEMKKIMADVQKAYDAIASIDTGG
jgi:hypothetical protein